MPQSISKSCKSIFLIAVLTLAQNFFGFANHPEAAELDSTIAHVTEEVTEVMHAIEEKEEAFNPSDMIMHHIADAHEFHLFGEGHASVSIPLPVILYTNTGLAIFMSSAFHHDDNATEVVEAAGSRLVKMHDKIYYASEAANEHGQYVEMDEAHHPHNAMPLDFSITKNVFTLLLSVIILILMFTSVAKSYRNNGISAPKGLAAFIEPIVLFVRDDIARPNLGEKNYRRFMPYLLTAFFFIWFNNTLGLIPIFPGGANLTGNIAVTMVLALCTLIITNVNGTKDYWKHIFWMPGVPVPIKILLAPIELVGVLTKPVALMIRLFANISAGHILVLSLISLIFIFQSIAVAGVAIPFTVFISLIELLVAFIQAFIFTVLSALFIGLATEEHEHHEEAHH